MLNVMLHIPSQNPALSETLAYETKLSFIAGLKILTLSDFWHRDTLCAKYIYKWEHHLEFESLPNFDT